MTSDNLKIEDVEYATIQGGTIMYQSRTGRGTLVHAPEMEIVIRVQGNGYYSVDVHPSSHEADGEAVRLLRLWLDRLDYSDPYLDKPKVLEYLKRRDAPEGKE